MYRYRAIFLDIDGTLFSDSLAITERTREAIRRAYRGGVRIVLISGRYITGMQRAQEQLGLPVIYAAINGALIKDGDEYLRSQRVDMDAYRIAAEYLDGKVASLIAFCETRFAINSDDAWFDMQTGICGAPGIRMDVRDPEEVERRTGEKPGKLLVKDDDRAKLDRLMEEIRPAVGDRATVISSGSNNFEILPYGTDKSDALSIVADHLGIPLCSTMAFGDWDNDAGMIAAAGFGIAMANGSEKAKAAADYVTLSNNEDGIAAALERFLFQEE